jgi:hypothetical protein
MLAIFIHPHSFALSRHSQPMTTTTTAFLLGVFPRRRSCRRRRIMDMIPILDTTRIYRHSNNTMVPSWTTIPRPRCQDSQPTRRRSTFFRVLLSRRPPCHRRIIGKTTTKLSHASLLDSIAGRAYYCWDGERLLLDLRKKEPVAAYKHAFNHLFHLEFNKKCVELEAAPILFRLPMDTR